MNPKRLLTNRRRSHRPKGAALVMTLIILVLLSILITGFVVSMRTEMRASYSTENIQRTKMIAQGAVSHAIDLLRTNIPEPARLGEVPSKTAYKTLHPAQPPFIPTMNGAGGIEIEAKNWVVNPGRLTIIPQSGSAEFVDLHTGEATGSPASEPVRDGLSVDLNEPFPGDERGLPAIAFPNGTDGFPYDIIGKSDSQIKSFMDANRPKMRVAWKNVYEDPSEPPSATNPMVGRYAFWMDDECAKINFNTALGKPDPSTDATYKKQLFGGPGRPPVLTPMYRRGDPKLMNDSAATLDQRDNTLWSLGHPGSVNLDHYVENSSSGDLLDDKLLVNMWNRGFSRYPEAMIDYVDMDNGNWNDSQDERDWYRANRWNLTHYSRAPEFNAFGVSRFFTTNVPISLEGGPLYQLPFTYGTGKDRLPHLHSLMGNFGVTQSFNTADGKREWAGNVINRAQHNMLMRYLGAEWPGYSGTFLQKYGFSGCAQICLNINRKARVWTTVMSENDSNRFNTAWSLRNTSTNYVGTDYGRVRNVNPPQHMYWKFFPPKSGNRSEMLPQMGGPHIMEVHWTFWGVQPDSKKPNEYVIAYKVGAEFYMHPYGPVVGNSGNNRNRGFAFPVLVDFAHLDVVGKHAQTIGDPVWRKNNITVLVSGGKRLGPDGGSLGGVTAQNRIWEESAVRYIGEVDKVTAVADIGSAHIFNASQGSSVDVDLGFVMGMSIRPDNQTRPKQMIPLIENPTWPKKCMRPAAPKSLDLRSGEEVVFAWELSGPSEGDPRLSWNPANWIEDLSGTGTPGQPHPTEPHENSSDKSKFRVLHRAQLGTVVHGNEQLQRNDEYATNSRVISPGYWSLVHTGMYSNDPWDTLSLEASNSDSQEGRNSESGSSSSSPPDWLLLDLFGATYPMQRDQWRRNQTGPDEFSTISFMNSTMGKINLNTRIYPRNANFEADELERRKPLEAVFKHLRTDAEIDSLVNGIIDYQGDNQWFDYIGELAEVNGYMFKNPGQDNAQFDNESPLRNMAGCLTTNSNTFGVWGVAQTVKKSSRNAEFDELEIGDEILGEKRFYAVIERYVWPGKDGVPGNAHVSSSGKWDRLAKSNIGSLNPMAKTNTLYGLPGSPPLNPNSNVANEVNMNIWRNGVAPEFDGPEPVSMDQFTQQGLGDVTYSSSSLEDAYNPPQPVIKYRIAYFKYLDR